MNIQISKTYEIVCDHNYVPIEVYKFRHPKLLWMAPDKNMDPADFLEKYAIGIPESKCFENVEFYMQTKKIAYADRYGGYGGASNGGGSRCANLQNAQIKGVGTNKLLGKSVINSWYAHGSLNIVDAVCEVIYSDILNKIMPNAAVKSLGLILVSNHSGYYGENVANVEDAKTCRGALIIRDECIRPAHFLRARNYVPLDKWKNELINDVSRVRNINKSLLETMKSNFDFIEFVSHMLRDHANQFAFAKAARIIHGSTTSSNLTIDGKWLDFAATSFLPSGENYQTGVSGPAFLDEHINIEEIFSEFCDTYTKFNNFDLNIDPLLAYFRAAMPAYFHQHCSFVLGIPIEIWPEQGVDSDADLIAKALFEIIHKNSTPEIASPKTINDNTDPVLIFISGLYGTVFNNDELKQRLSTLFEDKTSFNNICNSFLNLTTRLLSIAHSRDIHDLLLVSAAESIKRSYCSAFFYRGRLRDILSENLFVSEDEFFTDFIKSSIAVADFVFDKKNDANIQFFMTDKLKIWYCKTSRSYKISSRKNGETSIPLAKDFFDFIEINYRNELVIYGFNFYTLLSLLRPILSTGYR